MSRKTKPEIDYQKEFYRKEYEADQALGWALKAFLIVLGVMGALGFGYQVRPKRSW